MNTTNPYAQAGWQTWPPTTPEPPTFGALPYTGTVSSPNWISIAYETADGDVLDCTLRTPSNKAVYEVATEILDDAKTATTFSRSDGRLFAKIEWNDDGGNFVEIQGVLPRRDVLQWVRCPREEMSGTRVIRVAAHSYTFERHRETIYMYHDPDLSQSVELLAKFYREHDSPVLDVTPKSITEFERLHFSAINGYD
ncbi:unnamed protein product [Cyclocybe aegerita]|uniref:Uncharacterized protein n=1 Tax=Cyclocybe aegerita TaxID=1973307 RepID=A0A8S0W3L9_CYCAE|nr:unnamed protein product [Cyclocybe aegerita]